MRFLVKREDGFSLIELSIAMVLVGLFVASTLEAYKIYKHSKVKNETEAHAEDISSALEKFFVKQGRYPCPADPAAPLENSDSGEEKCALTIAVGACTGGGTLGICRVDGVRDADLVPGVDPVLVGAIPFTSLNISSRAAVDGWGRRYGYAVTEPLAKPPVVSPFPKNGGAIEISDPSGITPVSFKTKDAFELLIWSFGSDGKGAYTTSGVRYADCGAATESKDFENCNVSADAKFLYPHHPDDGAADGVDTSIHLRSLGSNADFYDDDLLIMTVDTTGNRWDFSSGDINNSRTGKVGINVSAPTQALDINGNLRANDATVVKFCDIDGNNCFAAGMISGTGVGCNGMSLSGVGYGGPVCDERVTPGSLVEDSCPTGQLVKGISSTGEIICGNAP